MAGWMKRGHIHGGEVAPRDRDETILNRSPFRPVALERSACRDCWRIARVDPRDGPAIPSFRTLKRVWPEQAPIKDRLVSITRSGLVVVDVTALQPARDLLRAT